MSNRLELTVNTGLQHTEWAFHRGEKDRYTAILRQWLHEHPKATIEQQMIADQYIWLHILIQRLKSRAVFLDGTKTSFLKGDMLAEDIDRKQNELREWLPVLMRQQLEYLKIALAQGINLISLSDNKSITDLIRATRNQQEQNGQK